MTPNRQNGSIFKGNIGGKNNGKKGQGNCNPQEYTDTDSSRDQEGRQKTFEPKEIGIEENDKKGEIKWQ